MSIRGRAVARELCYIDALLRMIMTPLQQIGNVINTMLRSRRVAGPAEPSDGRGTGYPEEERGGCAASGGGRDGAAHLSFTYPDSGYPLAGGYQHPRRSGQDARPRREDGERQDDARQAAAAGIRSAGGKRLLSAATISGI